MVATCDALSSEDSLSNATEPEVSTDGTFDATRLVAYPGAIAFAFLAAQMVLLLLPADLRAEQGVRIGGDWPAFYAAAETVWTGQLNALYDWGTQRELQAPFVLEEERHALIPFPYPPVVAIFLSPLTVLGYTGSYLVSVAGSLVAVAIAITRLGEQLGRVRHFRAAALASALAFAPLVRAIYGGQNTAITLLLITVIAVAPTSWGAMVALGLLWAKPQFAVWLAVVLVLRGHWKTVLASCLIPAIATVGTAVLWGGAWWEAWLDALARFQHADQGYDVGRGLTPYQVVGDVLGPTETLVVALLLGGAVVSWTMVVARRVSTLDAVVLMTAAMPFALPHMGFYDGGLMVLPMLWLAAALGRRALWPSVAMGALLLPACFADPPVPGVLLAVQTVVWLVVAASIRARRRR